MKNFPLFPLKLFLVTGEFTQLYIFEERYKQLVKECFASGNSFGIPYSGKLNIKNLGALVKVTEIRSEEENGNLDIIVEAVGTFVLERFYFKAPDKLYPAGDIKIIEQFIDHQMVSKELFDQYQAYFRSQDLIDPEMMLRSSLSVVDIINTLSLSDFEKMEIVQLPSQEAVEFYLKNYLRYLQLLEDQEKNVYQNIYLN